MPTYTLEDIYLPPHLQSVVENYIARRQKGFIGQILTIDELTDLQMRSISYHAIASCARSLTVAFCKPFYFCVSAAGRANAVMASLESLHVMIVGERLCEHLVQLVGGLTRSTALQAFLRDGVDPDEPEGDAIRSRDEAVHHVLRHAAEEERDSSGGLLALVTDLTMRFLAAHEVGHVALGHLESRIMADGLVVESEDEPSANPAESRALEWDADGFAAAATIWHTGAGAQIEELAQAFPDLETGLRHFFVAAYIFFSALETLDAKAVPAKERSHPAPMIRVMLMAFMAGAVCESWGKISGEAALEIAKRAVRAVEITLFERGGGCMEADQAMALGEALEEQLMEVTTIFAALKPTLNRSRLAHYFWARGFE